MIDRIQLLSPVLPQRVWLRLAARRRIDITCCWLVERGASWLAVQIWRACGLWSTSVPRRSALFGIVRRTARDAR